MSLFFQPDFSPNTRNGSGENGRRRAAGNQLQGVRNLSPTLASLLHFNHFLFLFESGFMMSYIFLAKKSLFFFGVAWLPYGLTTDGLDISF